MGNKINSTLAYYNQTASIYFTNTVAVDMSAICNKFLSYLPRGVRIVDIGAGSGRELRYFKAAGYEVEGIDASIELCKLK